MVRKLTQQIGTSWANILQDIGYIYNVPEIDFGTIKEMLKDETVQAALKFQVMYILNFLGSYAHDAQDIQDFVLQNFENLEESLETVLENMLYFKKSFGFSVAELVWEEKNGKLVLKKIVSLPPDTIQFLIENGKIRGLRQVLPKKTVEIPAEKLFILKEGKEPYGKSSLQFVYRPWKFKSVLFKFWAMAMERYAAPVLVGKTPNPSNVNELLEALQELWSNGIISVTNDVSIETLEAKNDIAEPFERAIEYADMLIYRAFLLPQLLVSTRDVGSKALGEVHLKLFTMALHRETRKLADDLIDQVVAKIIDYNFSDIQNYGRFLEKEEPTTEDRAKLSQALGYLVQSGFLDPAKDSKWVRELLGFPNPEETEVDEFEGDEEIWNMLQQSQKHWIEQKKEL